MFPPSPLLTPELVLSCGEPSTTAITLVLIKTTTELLQKSFSKPRVLFLPLPTSVLPPLCCFSYAAPRITAGNGSVLALLPLLSFQLSIAPWFICPR